jgi:hypothetical protein
VSVATRLLESWPRTWRFSSGSPGECRNSALIDIFLTREETFERNCERAASSECCCDKSAW